MDMLHGIYRGKRVLAEITPSGENYYITSCDGFYGLVPLPEVELVVESVLDEVNERHTQELLLREEITLIQEVA